MGVALGGGASHFSMAQLYKVKGVVCYEAGGVALGGWTLPLAWPPNSVVRSEGIIIVRSEEVWHLEHVMATTQL